MKAIALPNLVNRPIISWFSRQWSAQNLCNYVAGTVLGSGLTVVNKTEIPARMELKF